MSQSAPSSHDEQADAHGSSSQGHHGPPQPFGPPIPGNRGPGFAALAGVSMFLVALVVGLRMARAFRNRIFRVDDGLILFCLVLVFVTNTLDCVGVYYGAGKHISNIPLMDLKYATKLPLIAASFLAITLAFAKTSVGLTLLHIDISKLYRSIIIGTVVLAVLGNIQLAIILPQTCTHSGNGVGPPSSGSHGTSGGQSHAPSTNSHCVPNGGVETASYLQAAINIATDILFVVTPMVGLRRIRLSDRDRLATNFLLLFMLSATILSIVKLANEPTFIRQSQDITWANIPVSMFGIGEVTLCIIAACLPAVRQLLGAHFPAWRVLGGPRQSTGTGGGSAGKSNITANNTMSKSGTLHQLSVVRPVEQDEQAILEESHELQTPVNKRFDEEKGGATRYGMRESDEIVN